MQPLAQTFLQENTGLCVDLNGHIVPFKSNQFEHGPRWEKKTVCAPFATINILKMLGPLLLSYLSETIKHCYSSLSVGNWVCSV